MSLSSLLLAASGVKAVDKELDDIFKSNPAPSVFQRPATSISVPVAGSSGVGKKRKSVDDSTSSRTKRSKETSESTLHPSTKSPAKKVKKSKPEKVEELIDDEDNDDLETTYLGVKDVAGGSDGDEVAPPILHESLSKGRRDKSSRLGSKGKYTPADETEAQRDLRTIFVGNLSVEVAQKRPLLKQLHRHILALIPTAKIESTRFRSVPFQTPTSKLPTSDDETETPASKQARQHDRERALTWREQQGDDDDGGKSDEKKFLNPKQKKKIAFINQEFHSSADTANAYIVFAHPVPVEGRPSNLPPPQPAMDPYEAARLATEKCDGSMFMERMIRVDHVGKRGGKIGEGPIDGDPKMSVFVGNLDFASKEEDLRIFFEGVVSSEKGPPEEFQTWVTRVRIVRDKETQLGKGFAYVQFSDRECVDEVLALEETKLRFAKRKLRVQRCKTLPGASSSTRMSTADSTSSPSDAKPRYTAVRIPVPIVPKGDPTLGEKLAHLPKDARKQAKSADADRVARRLAKKKARVALANNGVKPQVKDRDRVRKGPSVKKDFAPKGKESKGRVRSDKSTAKRNNKK